MLYSEYSDEKDFYIDRTMDVFKKFEIDNNFTKEGVTKNVNTWYENKAELIKLLRKHPLWNEEAKAIVFLNTENRVPNRDTKLLKFRSLLTYIIDTLNNWCYNGELELDGIHVERVTNIGISSDYKSMIDNLLTSGIVNIDESAADKINRVTGLTIGVGTKLSKALNKIFKNCKILWRENNTYEVKSTVIDITTFTDKPFVVKSNEELNMIHPQHKYTTAFKEIPPDESSDESEASYVKYYWTGNEWCYDGENYHSYNVRDYKRYDKYFAELSDAINPLEIKKITVLSVNYMDFMLMSNGNSWLSCHYINSHNIFHSNEQSWNGSSKAGCISYGNDSSTMMLYTINENYDGTDYYLEKKINRQLFHWNKGLLLQARLYPSTDTSGVGEQYKTIVQEIMSKCCDVPNRWISREYSSSDVCSSSHGLHYHDYCTYHTLTYLRDFECADNIPIGYDAYCVDCGNILMNPSNLQCEDCLEKNQKTCSICGQITNHFTKDGFGNYICDDCIEDYVYSKYANMYYPKNQSYYYARKDDWIPQIYLNEFTICKDCGDLITEREACRTGKGEFFCNECYHINYVECCKCGNSILKKRANKDQRTSRIYDDRCYHIILENRVKMLQWLQGEADFSLDSVGVFARGVY